MKKNDKTMGFGLISLENKVKELRIELEKAIKDEDIKLQKAIFAFIGKTLRSFPTTKCG